MIPSFVVYYTYFYIPLYGPINMFWLSYKWAKSHIYFHQKASERSTIVS